MRKNRFMNIISLLTGSLLYGTGICCFLEPANIAPGGVSGISIMLNYLFNAPIGISSILINLPILISGYIYLNKDVIKRTIPALVVSSLMIDLVIKNNFPVYSGDRILGSIFGGVIMGAGLGIIFLRGCTTGGTDVLSLFLKKKFPHLRIGLAMLIIDCIILTVSVFVFRDIESGMYGIISLFCSVKLVDLIVYSGDSATLTFIISHKHSEIASAIFNRLDRGVTILNASGGYTGNNIKIIMCAVRKQEFPILKETVFDVDDKAFLTSAASEGIFGEGFNISNPF